MSDTDTPEEFIASLPLDWGHYPADAAEGWDMVCRAKAKYNRLERKLSQARQDAERYRWLRDNEDVRRPIAIFFDSTKYSGEVNTAEETDAAIDKAMIESGHGQNKT